MLLSVISAIRERNSDTLDRVQKLTWPLSNPDPAGREALEAHKIQYHQTADHLMYFNWLHLIWNVSFTVLSSHPWQRPAQAADHLPAFAATVLTTLHLDKFLLRGVPTTSLINLSH